MGIQINGQTNNINAGIGSLSIEDLNEIDIVGVATASNFKTGSSNLHSTGLTVGNALVHSTGVNVGTGATVHCPATNVLTFGTNSNERIRITSTGLFGIGTDNPLEKLSIENGNIFIKDTSDNVSYIYFTHSPTANRRSYIGAVEGTGNSNSLVFATNGDGFDGTEKVRINSNGAVGIGTVNPHGSLHIHSGAPQLTLSDSDTGAHGQINCTSSEGNLYVEVDKFSGITTAAHKPRFGVRLRGKEWFGITHNGTWRLDNGYGSMETGSAGQVLTSGGPNSWARWTDQTDVLDMWRIASDVTDSDQTVRFFGIGDWVQKTGDPYANLGYIGAYETNGIFRMPSTGYYEIEMIIGWKVYNATCKGCTNAIYTTTDNSTYTAAMTSAVHTGGGQAGTNESCNKIKLFWKVNNISNDKFKISYSSHNGNPYIESETSWLYIKKLRDL